MSLTRLTSKLITFMARTLHSKLTDTVSLMDFQKTTTEEARWAAAISYLNTGKGGTLLIPAGDYNFTGTVSLVISKRIRLSFQPGAVLNQTVDSDLFNFTSVVGGVLDVEGPGVINAKFGVASTASAALRFKGSTQVRSFVCTGSLQLFADQSGGGAFRYGLHLTDVQDGVIRDNLFSALQGTYHGTAIYITAISNPSVSWTIDGIDSYNHEIDIDISGTRNPGVEGVKLFNCDLVSSKHGLRWINTSSYVPPQLEMIGCHVNTKSAGVVLSKVLQVHVMGGLYYRSITSILPPEDIARGFFEFTDVQDWAIVGASMSVVHSSINVPAILITGTSGAFGRIDSTHFWMNGRNGPFVKLVGAITRLQLGGGCTKDTSGVWVDTSGYTSTPGNLQVDESIRLTDLDWETLANVYVDGSSGTFNLGNGRRGLITISNVDASSVITGVTSVEPGKMYTFRCQVAGVTINRTANMLFRNTGNFVFAEAGDTVTMVSTAAGVLCEVARSNPNNKTGRLTMTTTNPSIGSGATAEVAAGTLVGMGVTDGLSFATNLPHPGFTLSVIKNTAANVRVVATNITGAAASFPLMSVTVESRKL